MKFEVVTDQAKIGKPELLLLLHMLQDIEKDGLSGKIRKSVGKIDIMELMHAQKPDKPISQVSAEKYGYDFETQTWNDDKFKEYTSPENPDKMGLYNRMTKSGYTFFLLRDDDKNVVALASGNASKDKSNLRMLNFTVAREHRRSERKYASHLLVEICNHAADPQKGYKKIVAPLSQNAVNAGRRVMYMHAAKSVGLNPTAAAKEGDPTTTEITVIPKHIDKSVLQGRGASR